MSSKQGRGDFFLVDMNKWPDVCEAGVYCAISYLVLACGTGRDNEISTWSVQAIEKKAGIGRPRAQRAMQKLIDRKLITRIKGGARPHHRIQHSKEPRWVYLPNALITGAVTELAPIERIRRRGSIQALRMLVEFYYHQELAADGGVAWSLLRGTYERQRITERGRFVIWGFSSKNEGTSPWSCPLRSQFGRPSEEAGDTFWDTLSALEEMSLIQRVRHLVEREGEEAEIVFPCPTAGSGTEIEADLTDAAHTAAWAMVEDVDSGHKYEFEDYDLCVPVPDSYPDVIAVDVYRTRYRARTAATSAWWAQQQEWERFAEQFRELGRQASAGESLTSFPQKSAVV